jgi:hypothetical protein
MAKKRGGCVGGGTVQTPTGGPPTGGPPPGVPPIKKHPSEILPILPIVGDKKEHTKTGSKKNKISGQTPNGGKIGG